MLIFGLFLLQAPVTQAQATIDPSPNARVVSVPLDKLDDLPKFPDRNNQYNQMIAEKEAARIEAEHFSALKAAQDAEAARTAQSQPLPVRSVYTPPKVAQVQTYSASVAGLIGSRGYLSSMNNCVAFASQFGKNQSGNPISWSPTTQTPFIGAGVLFYFNHVAILTGYYSDGSVEVAHANCYSCGTHYPRSAIRGFF